MNPTSSAPISRRIVIVGGVAGGASAAARLRRLDEHAEITLIERGPDVSFANCGLPYHIGGEIADRDKLSMQTPQSLHEMLAIDVRARTEAVSIDRSRKMLRIRHAGVESELAYDKLILSPGASPIKPPLPGIDLPGIHTLRNLQDMDRIKTATAEASRVLIIGAGFIGLEMAEQMARLGKQITLVEQADQVLPQMDPEMVQAIQQELIHHDIEWIPSDGIRGFESNDRAGLRASLASGRQIDADMVVLSIGVRPESGLAKDAGPELGARGHIRTNGHMQTSDPDIYAVGDASETTDPIFGGATAIALGGPANRQGRSAADHIVLGDAARPYPGTIGTSIVRVFDMTAGITGASEKRLQQLGVDYGKTLVTDYHHASYFPGATQLTLKLLWESASGRILGAQAYGPNAVDKRLDVIATAIKGRLTVEDLEHLELAYAPPFGSAKDVINTAGFSATNIRSGLVKPIYQLPEDGSMQIIDVRPREVAQSRPIANAIHIPAAELRARLNELDRTKPAITVCALGKTSYFTARILSQHGFDAWAHVGGQRVIPQTTQPSNPMSPAPTVPSSPVECLQLDACGLSCPGPILRVKEMASQLHEGQILEIKASDSGFRNDLPAFCKANGYEFLGAQSAAGIITARIRRGDRIIPTETRNGSTIVVFSGDLDKALAALIIANGAVAMGGKATLFFTFWGLNVLRKHPAPTVSGKSLMDKIFGWMLPTGIDQLPLSRMHMAGIGTRMMKDRMAAKNLPNLPDLMATAQKAGVRMVACTMSMEAMGIRAEELIDGIELGGVADYLGAANETHANLFI